MKYHARGIPQLQQIADTISRLSPQKVWTVEVKQFRERRSTDQNNLAWRIYRAVAAEIGESNAERVHEAYRELFGDVTEYKCPITGLMKVKYSTHDQDVGWFSNYLERVMAHAATEFGVVVQD